MKWFKHIADSLDDPFIFDLISKFKGDGYLVFFGTLEIMSREFKVESPGVCDISLKFLAKKLQLSPKLVVKILNFCSENGRILYSLNNDRIILNCPKLIKMCDEFTQKALKEKSGLKPDSKPTHSGTDKEAEAEEEKEDKDEKQDAPDEELKEVVTRVQNAFPKFNVFPFIQTYKKENRAAMIYTLNRLMDYHAQGIPVRSPYKFCMDVMANENGKFNAREHEARAQEYKGPITDPTILAMVKNIGK